MTLFRLRPLFHADSGRCFDVAADHGFFNERAFLAGMLAGEALETAADLACTAGAFCVRAADAVGGLPGGQLSPRLSCVEPASRPVWRPAS